MLTLPDSQFIKQQVQVRKQLEADKKAEEISRRCQAIYTTQSVCHACFIASRNC